MAIEDSSRRGWRGGHRCGRRVQGRGARRRGGRLHRVRGRRLQPVRHPLRPRQGDPELRVAVPRHEGGSTSSQGIDIRYETAVTEHRPRRQDGRGRGRGRRCPSTASSWPPASTTPTRACRAATSRASTTSRTSAGRWSGTRSSTRSRPPWWSRPSPLGLEMVTALAHRGIETHVSTTARGRWPTSPTPTSSQPVQQAWAEAGRADALRRRARRRSSARAGSGPCETSEGEIRRRHGRRLHAEGPEQHAGQGGRAEDRLRPAGWSSTTAWPRRRPGVFAAGDCTEIPLGVDQRPRPGPDRLPRLLPGQGGRHQRRRRAGRTYQPVYVPWGMVAGELDDRRRRLRRDRGRGAGHPLRHGRGRRHLPGPLLPRRTQGEVKLLAEPGLPAAHRRPDGRRRGHQGAGRLPGHGRARPASRSRTWPPWRTSTRRRSARSTSRSRWPPRTPSAG